MVLGPVAGKLTADGLRLQNGKSMAGLAYSNQLKSELNELAKQ
jgi:hypothetical protein